MPSLIFPVSLSRTRIVTLCAPVRLTPTINPKTTLDGVLEKPICMYVLVRNIVRLCAPVLLCVKGSMSRQG